MAERRIATITQLKTEAPREAAAPPEIPKSAPPEVIAILQRGNDLLDDRVTIGAPSAREAIRPGVRGY